MTIDHTSLSVPEDKFQACLKLYLEALKPLGYEIRYQFGDYVVGLGSTDENIAAYNKADFWVAGSKNAATNSHIAFSTSDRATVDAFYAAAISARAKDNGAPGLRTHYHPLYYSAFVLDAAGNNIEVVCHKPE